MTETGPYPLSAQSSAPSGESPEENQTPPPPGDLSGAGARENLPRAFGGYELLEVVGRGGMGVVYKACQKSLNRTVALKMIGPGRLSSDTALRRFCQEAEAAARLDHPNIVSVYEFGTLEGQPFFSMAYVEGNNLQTRVQAGGLPTLAETLGHVRVLVDAVAFAHQQGIIHRDLKPANVLIDSQGRPRLVDFGLAKYCAAGTGQPLQTLTGEVMGTPAYMAPEQAQGDASRVGPLVDVYGLGGLLYFLLTGRAPFAGATVEQVLCRVLQEPPVPPRLLNPLVPAELEAICLKCLHKDPACRYPSAHDFGSALAKVSLAGAPAAALGLLPTVDAPPAQGPKARRRKLRLAGLVLLGLGVLLGMALSLPGWLSPASSSKKVGLLEPTCRDFALEVKLLGARGEEDGIYQLAAGDQVKLRVKVAEDTYVGVWIIEPDGAGATRVRQLFPRRTEPDHFFRAGQERTVPGKPLEAGPTVGPGCEQLWIVATTEPWEPNFALREGAFWHFRAEVGQRELLRRPLFVERIADAVLRYRVARPPE